MVYYYPEDNFFLSHPLMVTKLALYLLQYKKGASDHVYNGCIKLAKRAFNYAIKLKLISQNPFIDIKPVSVAPKLRHRFSTTEHKELIETCKEALPEYY